MKSKGFDAVAWMRKRRVEIDQEDAGLTWEEKSEKTRELLDPDPLWQRLKSRAFEGQNKFEQINFNTATKSKKSDQQATR